MTYTIGQIAEIIDGDRGKNYPKQTDFSAQGSCLFLNTGNVTTEGFSFAKNQFISQEKDAQLRNGKLMRGDIVYTTRGTVGNAALYDDPIPYEHLRINSGMVILRCHEEIADRRLLYQILKSGYYRPYFKSFCTGSAQPQLPIKNFSQIKIALPPIETQKRIADILSAYDDLIENNQKQIKLLEEAAQRLYKEWFIDLHFPGHENTPIINGIPEGWERGRSDSFFEISIGKTPPRAEDQWFTDAKLGLPWASISDMGECNAFILETTEGLTREAVEKFHVKLVPINTVLLSFKLTVGRVAISSMEMCTNEAIAHFYTNEIQRDYAYLYLKSFQYDTLGSTSSISKAVNSKIIKSMPFVMPDKEILVAFEGVVRPYFDMIHNKSIQIKQLKEARDRLLPKLMSGEIEV